MAAAVEAISGFMEINGGLVGITKDPFLMDRRLPKISLSIFLAPIKFIVAIFTFEAAPKLLGLGIRYYFYIDWNKFDFFIVIVSLVSETPFLGEITFFAVEKPSFLEVSRV